MLMRRVGCKVLTLTNPSDFKSEISLICFATSNKKRFSVGLKIRLDSLDNQLPLSCHETRKQPLLSAPKKSPEEDEGQFDEATVSQAAAKVICSAPQNFSTSEVSSELGGIFMFEEDQKMALKAFLCAHVFARLQTGFGKSLVNRCKPRRG